MHFSYIVHNKLLKKDKSQIYNALKRKSYLEESFDLLTLNCELFISLHFKREYQPMKGNESENIWLIIKPFKTFSYLNFNFFSFKYFKFLKIYAII